MFSKTARSVKNQNSNRGTRYETSPTTKGARATPLPLWNPPSSCPRSKLRGILRIKNFKENNADRLEIVCQAIPGYVNYLKESDAAIKTISEVDRTSKHSRELYYANI